jgi:protein-disulfide isomerase
MAKKIQSRAAAKAKAQRDQLLLIGGSAVFAVILVIVIGFILSRQGIDITNLFGGSAPAASSASNPYGAIPQSTTAEGAPALGNPDAKIVVMEFADFSCPHCAEYHDTIKQLIDTFVRPGKVKFIYQTLTIIGGAYSEYAGQAALCAGQQNHFWDMQDSLYKLQLDQTASAFNASGIQVAATNLDIDINRLMVCINSGQMKDSLAKSEALRAKMNVNGTPTMFISTDGGKTFNYFTDSGGQPINQGGPAFQTISDDIQAANQSASQ